MKNNLSAEQITNLVNVTADLNRSPNQWREAEAELQRNGIVDAEGQFNFDHPDPVVQSVIRNFI